MRLGILSIAHGHASSFAAAMSQLDGVELVGVWHEEAQPGQVFAEQFGTRFFASPQELLDQRASAADGAGGAAYSPYPLRQADRHQPRRCTGDDRYMRRL